MPEIEKEINDFDKEYAKGLWGKVKYYLKKTINFLLETSSKLLKVISIIFGYILMFYSFIGGLITSLIVLFLAKVDSTITNATSSEIVINGTTIYEINDFFSFDIFIIGINSKKKLFQKINIQKYTFICFCGVSIYDIINFSSRSGDYFI